MAVKLFIVRHGNTFESGEIPVRVGRRTDIDLSQSGRLQAQRLGQYFKQQHIQLNAAYSSQLRRCYQTAAIMLESMGLALTIDQMSQFDEIDYGPDEGKTEQQVIARIGEQALDQWNKAAIVPPGWLVNPETIISHWHKFADHIVQQYHDQAVVVVTSNGIARFAPYILDDVTVFKQNNSLKVATGSVSSFIHVGGHNWELDSWNVRPGK